MHEVVLQVRCLEDEEFRSTIHMLAALAFAPPNGVIDLSDTLVDCNENIYEHFAPPSGRLSVCLDTRTTKTLDFQHVQVGTLFHRTYKE